jgi:excinuclease UvrABC nuclease subunit
MTRTKSKYWDAIYAQAFVQEYYNFIRDGNNGNYAIIESAIEEAEALADWHDEVYNTHTLATVPHEGDS